MKNILLVDDNEFYREKVKFMLQANGYNVIDVGSVIDAYEVVKSEVVISAIVLDYQLGDMNGFDLIKMMVHNDVYIPVTMITGSEDYRIEIDALSYGVVNFIKKPVQSDVLIARIEYLLNQSEKPVKDKYYCNIDNIVVDVTYHKVLKNNEEVELTSKEFDLLLFLIMNKNSVVSREDIYQNVWNKSNYDSYDRFIDVHIRKLRQKLELTALISSRGKGYEWIGR